MAFAFQLLVFTFSLFAVETKQEPLHSVDEYLHSQLVSYELLQPVKLIHKRDVADGASTEHLQFRAFNRKFRLTLRPNDEHLTQQQPVSIVVVQNETQQPVDYDTADLFSDFFTGYIDDDPNSHVSGYKDAGRFHLTIYEGDSQVLNIEPLSLLTGNLSDQRLVAFYDSSINDSQYRCGLRDTAAALGNGTKAPAEDADDADAVAGARTPHPQIRRRRATTPKPMLTTCQLHVVADHTFVSHVASVKVALKAIIKAVDDVNEIYLGTEFTTTDGATFTGIGFQLSNLTAMTEPTVVQSGEPLHFNAAPKPGATASASRLLEAFGDTGQNGLDMEPVCLAHLVTFRRLSDRTLGLAYQSGICTYADRSQYGRGRMIFRKIGLTTFSSQEGVAILTRQATLVMAHELAHNFGSPHDPPAGECNPGPKSGGNYLVHWKSVSGQQANNNRLSPCSRRAIGNLVQARRDGCLRPSGNVCGNGRLDAGEACDAGPLGDACCGADCRLLPGARCSDANAACCRECRLAPAGSVCRRGAPLRPCRSDALCTGANDTCPDAGAPLSDGAVCLQGIGRCHGGSCRTLCQLAGRDTCRCPEPADSCLLCCAANATGSCDVFRLPTAGNESVVQWPGCGGRGGGGVAGVAGGMTTRLFRLAWEAGGSAFAAALRKNMAFIAIFLSLLIWMPVCNILEYRAHLYNNFDYLYYDDN